MLRLNYSIISKIALSLLVIIALVGVFVLLNKNTLFPEKAKQSSIVKALPEFLTKLQQSWQIGDLERAQKFEGNECLVFSKNEASEENLGCNSLYFECLMSDLERANFSYFEVKGLQFIPQKNSSNNYLEKSDGFVSLNIFEKTSKKIFKVKLQNSCNSIKLPKSKYSAGPEVDTTYVWDNYLYDVYIDRRYVNRFEVWNWALRKGKPEVMLAMEGDDTLFMPALNLDANLQKLYCMDQGKQLLHSRFFDAATFYPTREPNKYKYPFTWTKSRESFLTKDKPVSLRNCRNAFVKECQNFALKKQKGFTSVSWAGIHYSLGGHSEHFQNKFNPDANLKVSHSNLERSSSWHRAGVRAFWDGGDVEESSFNFIEQYTGRLIDNSGEILGVAFRCMEVR